MAKVQEAFAYKALAASGVVIAVGGTESLGGFFCTTAGSLKVWEGSTAGGNVIVNTFPVVAGTYYPIPCTAPLGAYFDLTGGAVGTAYYG